jgi:hypothetical protein
VPPLQRGLLVITLERLEALAAETAESHGISIIQSRAMVRLATIKVAIDLGIACACIHAYIDEVAGSAEVPS